MQATRTEKVTYWIATGYVLFAMGWSVVMYHVMPDGAAGFFERFGYPTYLVYPLAYLKLIAIIVIVTNRYNNLKEMVYGAYYINMIMATTIPVSYIYSNKVRGRPQRDLPDFWSTKAPQGQPE